MELVTLKIILEGPDGTGKSTLAQHLNLMTGFPIQHRSKPETEEEKQQMYRDYTAMVHNSDSIIVDRCWYSEMVYGKVMRDQSYIDPVEMLALEQLISINGGGLIIHCTDKVDVIWKRLQSRGEDYITDFHKLAEITFEYEMLMHQRKHALPVLRYAISKKMY
jgi:thymidylate kinase